MRWNLEVSRWAAAIAVAGCAACATHSSAGSFVTDLQVLGDQLIVSSCRIDHLAGNNFETKSSHLSTSSCESHSESLPPAVTPVNVPPGGAPGADRP